jgi:hypothetical protein
MILENGRQKEPKGFGSKLGLFRHAFKAYHQNLEASDRHSSFFAMYVLSACSVRYISVGEQCTGFMFIGCASVVDHFPSLL